MLLLEIVKNIGSKNYHVFQDPVIERLYNGSDKHTAAHDAKNNQQQE